MTWYWWIHWFWITSLNVTIYSFPVSSVDSVQQNEKKYYNKREPLKFPIAVQDTDSDEIYIGQEITDSIFRDTKWHHKSASSSVGTIDDTLNNNKNIDKLSDSINNVENLNKKNNTLINIFNNNLTFNITNNLTATTSAYNLSSNNTSADINISSTNYSIKNDKNSSKIVNVKNEIIKSPITPTKITPIVNDDVDRNNKDCANNSINHNPIINKNNDNNINNNNNNNNKTIFLSVIGNNFDKINISNDSILVKNNNNTEGENINMNDDDVEDKDENDDDIDSNGDERVLIEISNQEKNISTESIKQLMINERGRMSKILSQYRELIIGNFSLESKNVLARSAAIVPISSDLEDGNDDNLTSEALSISIKSANVLDAGVISGICIAVIGLFCSASTVMIILYRRRYLNKPQTLSEPDSSGYIDDSTIRDNSDEMYSLDNDSFLNSLEAMTIQNYWTDNVKHTKL